MKQEKKQKVLLGRYRLVKKIASGGMGDVFEVFDTEREESIALKTVFIERLKKANLLRLEREGEALSRFNHPNIVRFHELKYEGKFIYFTMELVRGEALSQLIERVWRLEKGRIPFKRVLRIASSIASALEHAHGHSVLHRDVKPDNILIADEGRVVLTDFGLAKVKDHFSVTQAGQSIGTVGYFAPEQMRGDKVDERTDVYQLGLTLYEALTGTLPFGEDPPLMALKKRVKKPIPPPKDMNPDVPDFFSHLVIKSLRARADDRFQNLTELRAALEEDILNTDYSLEVSADPSSSTNSNIPLMAVALLAASLLLLSLLFIIFLL